MHKRRKVFFFPSSENLPFLIFHSCYSLHIQFILKSHVVCVWPIFPCLLFPVDILWGFFLTKLIAKWRKQTILASNWALLRHQCVAFCQSTDLTVPLRRCLIHEMEAVTHSFIHSFINLVIHLFAASFRVSIISKWSKCPQDVEPFQCHHKGI